jgi:hypothetical protein
LQHLRHNKLQSSLERLAESPLLVEGQQRQGETKDFLVSFWVKKHKRIIT